jgi:unsaturated chondroitin disaccharide hydrolase
MQGISGKTGTARCFFRLSFNFTFLNQILSMIKIDYRLKPEDLKKKLDLFWELSAEKIKDIDKHYDGSKGSPVYTVDGKYTTRGWTEWTQGFQYGSAILQYDATG